MNTDALIAALELNPLHPAERRLRSITDAVDLLASVLRHEVKAAADAGVSWPRIASSLTPRRDGREPPGLGNLFPGGTSPTTMRRTYL